MASNRNRNHSRGRSRSRRMTKKRKRYLIRLWIRRVIVIGGLLLIMALFIFLLVFGVRKVVGGIKAKKEAKIAAELAAQEEAKREEERRAEEEIARLEAEKKAEEERLEEEKRKTIGTPSDVADRLYAGYSPNMSTASFLGSEEMTSTYAILVNANTGDVVAQKDAEARINPASMTKILTVLVAAEKLSEADLDDTYEMNYDCTNYSYSNGGSDCGFMPGEVIPVRDLFYGTILPSGAEAAAGLALYTYGSLDAFVEKMNEKLDELGLSKTSHMTNVVGFYNENHYSTMKDMSVIMKAAIENKIAKEALTAHTYTTTQTEIHPDGITISNWFLRRIEDKDTHGEVICAKTGFVNQSGNCAASYMVSNDGTDYIAVTGNAHSSWRCIYDHVAIYDQYCN